MEMYLAGLETISSLEKWHEKRYNKPLWDRSQQRVLASFYSKRPSIYTDSQGYKSVMIDSGAFTYMMQHKKGKLKKFDIEAYTRNYCDFLLEMKFDLFFEMDIDSVVGYDKVKLLRAEIERRVQKPVIPVWHRSRGKEEFLRMCDEYKYVSVGGLVAGEIKRTEYDLIFPWLIGEAHKRGARIHGLGITYTKVLEKHHFDSADSAVFVLTPQWGTFFRHTLNDIDIYLEREKTKHMKERNACACVALQQWASYARFVETQYNW